MTATIESIGFTATHDGEVALAVLLRFPNGGTSQVQVLNEVGTFIWERLEEGPDALAAQIAAEFAVSPGVAAADLADFLKQLHESGALLAGE